MNFSFQQILHLKRIREADLSDLSEINRSNNIAPAISYKSDKSVSLFSTNSRYLL
jgi:hypothetical protein